jgi:hypothetical protein
MRNNSKEAEGNGYPLRITAVEVKVVDNPEAGAVGEKEMDFVKHMLPTLDWPALVQVGLIVLCIHFFVQGELLMTDNFLLLVSFNCRQLLKSAFPPYLPL